MSGDVQTGLRTRLADAVSRVRRDLLAEVGPDGHWIGELASSAVSTATAVSAMSLVLQHGESIEWLDPPLRETLQTQVFFGSKWLSEQQNEDGGWGDTDLSYSNIATTMLSLAALHLGSQATRPVDSHHRARLDRGEQYVDRLGRLEELKRRYGKDKTFAVPILTNAALAGQADWRNIAPLPFELACVPQSWYRFMQLPVVSYAIPALVAVGQARFHHAPPAFPPLRWLRAASRQRSLRVLERMQPASGGFLEATPLTSFVTMSLASIGEGNCPVVREAIRFLIESFRQDGSWPIDTNLATFNTTLALNAMQAAGDDVTQQACLDWLLSCQHRERHPFTGADPGGWGWTDLSGAVPDSDDTPGALLALAAWRDSPETDENTRQRVTEAMDEGARWLLGLQNRDGGWPTFCRGWGKLPFDRSGADLTAHAVRALLAWRPKWRETPPAAVRRGFAYLERQQRADGAWIPLWFGNQDVEGEENPVYGTGRALLAYSDFGSCDASVAARGYKWLLDNQNPDGGWGGGPARAESLGQFSSIEETAVAVAALAANPETASATQTLTGIEHLIEAVEQDRYRECWPIGFYFAKLWYHERLYPLVFTLDALGRATSPPAPANRAAPPK